MPIQKSKRQAQKSEKHLSFPDALTPVTRKLNFAEITGNLSKRQSQISKRRQSFSASSAPVTRKLSFAEITGNLSKRRSQISKRRQSFSASSTLVTCILSLAEITDNLSKISDEEESTAVLEYSSPTAAVLPKKLPHLPKEQIRQVKMIPCSMWRQRAEETSR
ncbi:hypothetical protein ACFXTN_011775 [Malus domestica]